MVDINNELPIPFSQESLDEIWKNIKEGKYIAKAKEVSGYAHVFFIHPERLYSDDTGDAMSVPINNGYERDIYIKRPDGQWSKVPNEE